MDERRDEPIPQVNDRNGRDLVQAQLAPVAHHAEQETSADIDPPGSLVACCYATWPRLGNGRENH